MEERHDRGAAGIPDKVGAYLLRPEKPAIDLTLHLRLLADWPAVRAGRSMAARVRFDEVVGEDAVSAPGCSAAPTPSE